MSSLHTMCEDAFRLGQGAFSEVYRVTDDHTGELLVCKVSSQLKLAEWEAELLCKIRHPLFPGYRGQELWQDRHYLLMEYICGTGLGDYVRKRGRLSVGRAVEIAMALAEGLKFLHEQSEPVIYRDMKPENVLIGQDGQVRLVDFGCACVAGRAEYGRAGSPGYAAPEQLLEEGCAGAESDVYGLGKLLYFMLTGQETKELVPTELERYERLPKELRQLIFRATQPNPQRRIPDMRTFMQQLEVCGERESLGRWLKCRRILWDGGDESSFYYEKNIRKGL